MTGRTESDDLVTLAMMLFDEAEFSPVLISDVAEEFRAAIADGISEKRMMEIEEYLGFTF